MVLETRNWPAMKVSENQSAFCSGGGVEKKRWEMRTAEGISKRRACFLDLVGCRPIGAGFTPHIRLRHRQVLRQ